MQDLDQSAPACIGIVAGAGPEAGLTFWRKVLNVTKTQLGDSYRGDLDAPRVRIVSEPILGYVTQMESHHELLCQSLADMIEELSGTCDRIVIACHALQGLALEVAPKLAWGKIVSLPDLVCDYARHQNLGHAGILGAPSVAADMAHSPYAKLADISEVESPADPDEVLNVILESKRIGATHPDIVARVARHLSGFSSETVFLACTDFSDIAFDVPGKTVVDILEIAAETIVLPDRKTGTPSHYEY